MKRYLLAISLFLGITLKAQDADFKSGVAAFENGLYEQSVLSLNKSLENLKAKSKLSKKDSIASAKSMADVYNYLGLNYQLLNRHDKAKEVFSSALPLFFSSGNKSGGASAFANLGISVYRLKEAELRQKGLKFSLEEIGPIMAYHLKAQQYHQELKDQVGVANDLNNIATMYLEGEFYSEASDYLTQALKIHSDIDYKGGMAYDLANLARLYNRTDDEASALKFYQRSAKILEDIGDREGMWRTYSFIGTIYESFMKQAEIRNDTKGVEENRKLAIAVLKKSVDNIEGLRGNFTNKDFFESYLRDKNPVYKRLIRLLKLSGDAAGALGYIERSKAKMSNDVINAGKLQIADIAGQKKIDDVQNLQKSKEDLEKKILDEKSKPADKQDKIKIDSLSKSLAKNTGDFNVLMIDLETKYPNIYQVIKVDPVQLADIQKQLSDDVVLLEYFPADDALYIFAITKEKIEARSYPIANTTLDSLVNKYRYYVSDVTSLLKRNRFDLKLSNWKKEGGSDGRFYDRHTKPLRDIMISLYDCLINPVWDIIKDDKIKNVTIVPAASLYYIPFQCLATETKDGDISFLIEKKAVNYLTAATLMDLVSKKKQSKINNILVFGNPDGSLPGAEEEAKIIKEAYSNAILYKNLEATKDKVRAQAAHSEVIHFATHGFLSGEEPQKSFLLMAPNKTLNEDDKLTLSEILRLPLKDKNEMIVLSACNTSMGKSATGVELISLSRAFAVAGAPTIVATLWPVDDESTKIIMVNFYAGLKKGLPKAEAMRQAQIALIRKSDFHIHPFFWAPYVMIGNPK